MRIDTIHIKNFRCFADFEMSFDPGMTVLVGINGAGKSAVLDAVSIGLGAYISGIDGVGTNSIAREDVRHIAFESGSRFIPQPQFPVTVKCVGHADGQTLEWTRSLNSINGKTTTKGAHQISDYARGLLTRVRGGENTILPVLGYYGTGRLWAQKREKSSGRFDLTDSQFSRESGYIDCLDTWSNEKLMLKWFKLMTMQEIQEGRALPELMAVKNAVLQCFSSVAGERDANLEYSLKNSALELSYTTADGERKAFPVKELSDGYKNTISMIADIAYRMAELNPHLENSPAQTPGVVLIDEIDLHLHPAWQRVILQDLRRIFPLVQFIVTTHAPAVISSCRDGEIVLLKDGRAETPSYKTYGRDINSIICEVMNVPARPDAVIAELNEFKKAMAHEDFETAGSKLAHLKDELGAYDPDIAAADVSLALEKMRKRL